MVPTLTILGRLSECTRAVIAVPEVPTALVTSASMTLCSCRSPPGAAIGRAEFLPRARPRPACDRLGRSHGDPLRPASPRLRSAGAFAWRPAAPGFAALAIGWGGRVATRRARLRRACDRLGRSHGDPLRPASPRLRSPWDHLRCGGVSFRVIPAAPGRGAVVAAGPHDFDRGAEPAARSGRVGDGADHDRIRDPGTDRRLRGSADDEGPD